MGYSARYHVASLAAVFLALAVGLLLGAGFGDEVIRGTAENLEESLRGDLEEAEAQIESLEGELDRTLGFAEAVYPALAGDTLSGRGIAVVALGERPDELRDDIIEALEPTGAEVSQFAVVREPPDARALRELLPRRRSQGSAQEREAEAARSAGKALVDGRRFFEAAQEPLLSAFSGEVAPVQGVVVVRDQPDAVADDPEATEAFEASFIEGMVAGGVPVVGVERTDADPSSIEFFDEQGLTTVNHIELTAGAVAMVHALRGAQGSFGVGEGAELLPPLLRRPETTTP